MSEDPSSLPPRLGHYLYAHRAVPRTFLRNPAAIMGILASDDAMEFLRGMWDVVAGELDDKERVSSEGLKLEHYALDDDTFVALVIMPRPARDLEAHFVAAVARLQGEHPFARSFTLDRIPGGAYEAAVLEWDTEGKHELHREACAPTREAFLDALEALVD